MADKGRLKKKAYRAACTLLQQHLDAELYAAELGEDADEYRELVIELRNELWDRAKKAE